MTTAAFLESLKQLEYYPVIKDFEDETSSMRKILNHPSLHKGEDLYIPYVRLLGLLLCASTKRMKADLLYQIVTGFNPKA